jgi:hypothetical protein
LVVVMVNLIVIAVSGAVMVVMIAPSL